jgi:2-amino-4-hydroxy-6-hydroxymethyldihydropteridine diphosphokinase
MRAGIALGANLGDRRTELTSARAKVFALPCVQPPFFSSSLYETEPVECEVGAGKFLNSVIEVGFAGEAAELLAELQRIEHELGRPATHERNRSRTIDLDLLYLGTRVVEETGLVLPHPRLQARPFVLLPLAEIRPELVLPSESRTVAELAANLGPTPAVVRFPEQW